MLDLHESAGGSLWLLVRNPHAVLLLRTSGKDIPFHWRFTSNNQSSYRIFNQSDFFEGISFFFFNLWVREEG